jgi:hypothetical protein
MNTSKHRRFEGLLLSLLLGLLLLFLSYLRIVGDSQSMEFHDFVLDSLFAQPIWGTMLGNSLLFFAFGVVFIHALYAIACWLMAVLSARAWPSLAATRRQHVLLWFLLLTVALLANNAATFVGSSLGEPYAEMMTPRVLGITLGRAILVLVVLAAALTATMAGLRWWREGGRLTRRKLVTMTALGGVYLAVSAHSILPPPQPTPSDKPNVILIGLDSLREDLVDETLSPHLTPNIAAYMKGSTWFPDAITPLARTFPALCSMFTGRHPHHSGAVMNLLPRNLVDDSESLPRVLGRAGYQTVYATDEVRFANIDTSYGFTQAITPPIGATEFLIGKVDDTPLLNLLVNTRLGSWLFPHVYANRGAANTYDPDKFVDRIDRELTVRQPLFFTVHLTLTHWPYLWAGAPIKNDEPRGRWPEYYLNAAHRVDQQFGDIMQVLEKKGALKNAIVVVYSDHGESFDAPYDALVPEHDPLIEALQVPPTWGHGTSVLAAHQFRIVLGMRRYGADWQAPRRIDVPASFEDIAPTIVDALGAKTTAHYDGRSLWPLLMRHEGADQGFKGRIRFTESEYQLPPGFANQDGKLSMSKLREAVAVYSFKSDTDRIEVKQSRISDLLIERQYAAVGQQFLVAAVPNKTGPGFEYLTVPLAGGRPRQMFAAPDSSEPEVLALWNALHAEFGSVFRARGQSPSAPVVANHDQTIPQNVTK